MHTKAAPIHQPTTHNANAVATAKQLIANSSTTHLATTALTSFMGFVSRSNTFSDKQTELKHHAMAAETRYAPARTRPSKPTNNCPTATQKGFSLWMKSTQLSF
jgi:Tfp pilus assembly protein PilE